MNNRAVMNQRLSDLNGLDFFPTPPWATRALCEIVVPTVEGVAVDPCAGGGHMAAVLKDYFREVKTVDVVDYGYPLDHVGDYLDLRFYRQADWIIMNPPFKLAEDFIRKALRDAKVGVAALVRTSFLEGVGRHRNLWMPNKPTLVAQFSERVPMVKGRYDPKASTATSYCWVVWDFSQPPGTRMEWIPPCRSSLEMAGDIDLGVNIL